MRGLALSIAMLATPLAAFHVSELPGRPHAHAAATRCRALHAVATAFDLGAYMEEKRLVTEAALDASLASTCKETEVRRRRAETRAPLAPLGGDI